MMQMMFKRSPWEIKLLQGCTKRGAVTAHYAPWFRRHGVANCNYYRIPIIDEIGSTGRQSLHQRETVKDKYRIVLLGGLQATATRTGLQYISKKVIPHLDRLVGKEKYEVHIIGGGVLPSELQRLKKTSRCQYFGLCRKCYGRTYVIGCFSSADPHKVGHTGTYFDRFFLWIVHRGAFRKRRGDTGATKWEELSLI